MNMFFSQTKRTEDIDLEKRLIMVRIASCFLCLFLINTVDHFDNLVLFDLTVLLYLLYNLALWSYLARKSNSRLFVISVFIDILFISILVYLRSGIQSDLYISYFIVLAYTLAKKQKHLVMLTSLLILFAYPIACINFSNLEAFDFKSIVPKLIVRFSIMSMVIFIMYNIRAEINYIHQLSKHAYEMALIDPLTKVYNRNMLNTINEFRKANPYCISFAMIDIDDFKVINDCYGHQKGDNILSHLGELIKQNIRADDICIRYGGEEFLLVFKNTDDETALKILNRIRSTFSEHIFYYEGKPLNCTISAGLAFGRESIDSSIIIFNADHALYEAKRNGKNNITVYSAS